MGGRSGIGQERKMRSLGRREKRAMISASSVYGWKSTYMCPSLRSFLTPLRELACPISAAS